jgi:hypothetical protein
MIDTRVRPRLVGRLRFIGSAKRPMASFRRPESASFSRVGRAGGSVTRDQSVPPSSVLSFPSSLLLAECHFCGFLSLLGRPPSPILNSTNDLGIRGNRVAPLFCLTCQNALGASRVCGLIPGLSKHGPAGGLAVAPSPRGRRRGCRRGARRSCLLRDGRRPGSRSTRRPGAGGCTSGTRP